MEIFEDPYGTFPFFPLLFIRIFFPHFTATHGIFKDQMQLINAINFGSLGFSSTLSMGNFKQFENHYLTLLNTLKNQIDKFDHWNLTQWTTFKAELIQKKRKKWVLQKMTIKIRQCTLSVILFFAHVEGKQVHGCKMGNIL